MRKAYTTPKFDRRLVTFIRSHPDLSERTRVIINRIVDNPFNPSLKTHRLSGQLKECLASNITYEYRVVFLLSEEEVKFIDIGSHDNVY